MCRVLYLRTLNHRTGHAAASGRREAPVATAACCRPFVTALYQSWTLHQLLAVTLRPDRGGSIPIILNALSSQISYKKAGRERTLYQIFIYVYGSHDLLSSSGYTGATSVGPRLPANTTISPSATRADLRTLRERTQATRRLRADLKQRAAKAGRLAGCTRRWPLLASARARSLYRRSARRGGPHP